MGAALATRARRHTALQWSRMRCTIRLCALRTAQRGFTHVRFNSLRHFLTEMPPPSILRYAQEGGLMLATLPILFGTKLFKSLPPVSQKRCLREVAPKATEGVRFLSTSHRTTRLCAMFAQPRRDRRPRLSVSSSYTPHTRLCAMFALSFSLPLRGKGDHWSLTNGG